MDDVAMTGRYVLLTGAKNNAGDYLIKYRAKELFAALRPDRTVLDYDAWKPLNEAQLAEINASRALILTGGPALQPHMYPGIYALTDDLTRIKVPIVTMAIGWKSPLGSWDSTHRYPLSTQSLQLLQRVEASGVRSSLRDYHTLSVLQTYGFNNFCTTGCAALFSLAHVGHGFAAPAAIKRISFSLGVSFFRSHQLAKVNRQLILELRQAFPHAELTVVFHHSLDAEQNRKTYDAKIPLLTAQRELLAWLTGEGIATLDISGSADAMIAHYAECDLHVGYRVHAHILMASHSRPTVLIAEDGRGTALKEVIGGVIFDGCFRPYPGLVGKLAGRLGRHGATLMASQELPQDVVRHVCYEIDNGYPRIARQREAIDGHFQVMKTFLQQLP